MRGANRRTPLRLGLCCTFLEEPEIKFRTTTARYLLTLDPAARLPFLREIALNNASALERAIAWCAAHGVGAFRIGSGMLPLFTHPQVGYRVEDVDAGGAVTTILRRAGELARRADVRLSFHPDQFVVPGSANEATVKASLAELEYMAALADFMGAVQLTIHGGGGVGGKEEALVRFLRGLDRLSPRARALVALENDDRLYTVVDLLPICRAGGLPLVYDVHHHRCNPDGLTVEEATELTAATWGGREPWAHISSPEGGWRASNPRVHADYIDPKDLPRAWLGRVMTVDVEAKAKELAVLRLRRWLLRQGALRG